MKKILLISIPFLALLLVACSTSKITNSYVAKEQTKVPSKKVLVVGLFDEKNKAAKREMEQQLVNDLKKFGYNAASATEVYGLTTFQNMKESEAIKRLREDGVESVITISLLDKNQVKKHVPGTGYYRPWGYNPYRPYAYYGPQISRGYTTTNTKYIFETNLYDVNSNQVIYSAQSESFDASTLSSLADDYGKTIVRDMRKKNVLS